MSIQVPFSTLDAVLADMHMIARNKSAAFSARIKHLHRLGFPAGVKPGRGKAHMYSVGEIVMIALAMEFGALQVPPERTVTILADEYECALIAISQAGIATGYNLRKLPDMKRWDEVGEYAPDSVGLFSLKTVRVAKPVFIYFDPMGYFSLMGPGGGDRPDEVDFDIASFTMMSGDLKTIAKHMAQFTSTYESRRASLINVTSMVRSLSELMFSYIDKRASGFEDAETFRRAFLDEMIEWALEECRRIQAEDAKTYGVELPDG